ncbi:16S rRNA (guanine(966)-N(2))-methyltransferase RsmD [Candidatus Saccharibacteria bacterium]|nr:16S rRNA (guanine(966)-N(2))-methyltransferase RsmD [Candidatus Saccharibacteria bacterium]
MRIISGIYKNKEILTPGTTKTHPMGSREKLALFNMIMPFLPSKTVLDAFSGSGALGLEALSRGASNVVFIDSDSKSCEIIKKNLKNLGENAENNAKVYKLPVKKLENPENSRKIPKVDIIFADPPYDNFDLEEVKILLNFLKKGGIFVLSSPKPVEIEGLTLLKSRKYAGCYISIFVI